MYTRKGEASLYSRMKKVATPKKKISSWKSKQAYAPKGKSKKGSRKQIKKIKEKEAEDQEIKEEEEDKANQRKKVWSKKANKSVLKHY